MHLNYYRAMSQYPLLSIAKASSLVTLLTDFSRHRFSLSDPVAKDFISLNKRTIVDAWAFRLLVLFIFH